jgi:hypothetical protein
VIAEVELDDWKVVDSTWKKRMATGSHKYLGVSYVTAPLYSRIKDEQLLST